MERIKGLGGYQKAVLFLLIIMVAAVLYRKLVLDRDEDTFDWEL